MPFMLSSRHNWGFDLPGEAQLSCPAIPNGVRLRRRKRRSARSPSLPARHRHVCDPRGGPMGEIQRWSVGAITVTVVRESLTPVDPAGLFPDVDVAAVFDANAEWLRPHFVNDDGTLPLSIHCLVVESMGQTIVID